MEKDLISPFKKLELKVPHYKERESDKVDLGKINTFIQALDPMPNPVTERQLCMDWFANTQMTVSIFGLNSSELLRALLTKLSTHKHHIMTCLHIDDPLAILENLSSRILKVQSFAGLDEILNFKMNFNESIESYFTRGAELISRSDLVTESQKMDLLTKGLPNDWKTQLIACPESKNVEDLYKQLVTIEDRRRKLFRSKSDQKNFKKSPEKSKKSNSPQSKHDDKSHITCYACGFKGHYASECTTAPESALETQPFNPRNVTLRRKEHHKTPSTPSQPQKSATPSDSSRFVAKSPYKPPGQRNYDIAAVHEQQAPQQQALTAPNNNNTNLRSGSDRSHSEN